MLFSLRENLPLISFIFLVALLFSAIGYFFYLTYTSGYLSGFFIKTPTYKKETVFLHFFGNDKKEINNVLIRVYYFIPEDKAGQQIDKWQQVFDNSLFKVARFFEVQFGYNMHISYHFYSKPLLVSHSSDYLNGLLLQDFKNELANPHFESLVIQTLKQETLKETKEAEDWQVAKERIGQNYIINLFVLQQDPIAQEGVKQYILGLNDEKNNSLVMSYLFFDESFKPFGESVIAQEITHAMGVPDFYSLSDDRVFSYGVMGSGIIRNIENNFLDLEIKKNMGY